MKMMLLFAHYTITLQKYNDIDKKITNLNCLESLNNLNNYIQLENYKIKKKNIKKRLAKPAAMSYNKTIKKKLPHKRGEEVIKRRLIPLKT